jgi:4-amino-4-deoxy-L-arabinose transferase-like glycosyltransferase
MDPFKLALALIAGLTLLRVAILFVSPLQLYPDEAQYWVWSRSPAFGYFSKPPLIAWLIGATTAVGGDSEAWIRLSAPLLHAAAAVVLALVGRKLYGPWAGFWAAVIYSLMPGVQLSSVVIATDAPLLLFVSLALWAYVGLLAAERPRARLAYAVGLGLFLGLACLAKYAALYFALGLILHGMVDRRAREGWSVGARALTCVVLLACVAPNFIWNMENSFHTVTHTVANLGQIRFGQNGAPTDIDLRQAPGFFLSQFGVFGPVPFAVLIGGAVVLARRRRLQPEDRMLLCFALPPLIIVLVEAAVSRANANWAGAAYSPASVLVAGWLVRWGARRALAGVVVPQALLAAAVMVVIAAPSVADRTGIANSIKRARGWREASDAIMARLAVEKARGPVSALAVDDRFLFNATAYYARHELAAPGAPPLRIWVREAQPNNQAEATAPLTSAEGARVVFAQAIDVYRQEALADFTASEGTQRVRIPLDPRRTRDLTLFVGLGFAPLPVRPQSGEN